MKLAVISDEIDNDVEHALDVMAEYGVCAVELRSVWDKNISDAPDSYIDRIRGIVESRGVSVVGIASPFFKCDMPDLGASGLSGPMHDARPRSYSEQIDLLNRCIEVAKLLGTSLVRVFTFWRAGELTTEIEDKIVSAFAEPAAIASQNGITLIIENEHSCFVGTGVETARVIQRIGSGAVRAVWDPGNAFFAGEEPYPAGYEAIATYVAHVHVKDAVLKNGDAQWCVVGEGEIDWAGQLQALKRNGYSGYLSLETHYRGAGTKEASSRECLAGLIRLTNDL